MSVVDRYLLREIALPFWVGLALFFVVVSFAELLKISDAVTGLGISASDFAQAVLFSLPPLVGLLLPVSALFAILLAIGRMASDRELTALWALGHSPYRLLRVPLGVALILACLCAWATLLGEPWGIRGLKDVMARGAQRNLAAGVQVGQLTEWVEGVTFLARSEVAGELGDIVLADRRDPQRPVVLSARQGRVRPGEESRDIVFDLRDGALMLYQRGSPGHRVLHFDESQYRIDVSEIVRDKLFNVTRAQSMYPWQLWEASQDENRSDKGRALCIITLHRKIALPLATIIFALLAVPLASRPSSGARARGFLWSCAIVVAYYYIGRAVELSARSGAFPAELAAWVPNGIALLALPLLLRRLGRGHL